VPDKKRKRTEANGSGEGHSPPRTGGSYFLSLEVENVRCFGKQQRVDLSDGQGRPAQWTILLGVNGTGKTTILQLLTALEPMPVGINARKLLSTIPRVVSLSRRREGQGFAFQSFLRSSTALTAIAKVNFAVKYTLGSNASPTVASDEMRIEVTQLIDKLYVNGNDYPFCCGYGAGRRSSPLPLAHPDLSDPAESLFFDDGSLRNAEEWLLQLDYSASKTSKIQPRQQRRLDMVKDILVKVLPDDVSKIKVTDPTLEKQIP
jgi:hypothetical protein